MRYRLLHGWMCDDGVALLQLAATESAAAPHRSAAWLHVYVPRMAGFMSFRPSKAAVLTHPRMRSRSKPMNRALKLVLIGSMVAALAACHRDGDKNAQDQNAATPPAAADGSPAGGNSAPATGTSGDATGTATGTDPSQTPPPVTPTTPTTDPQSPISDPQQQQQPPADNQQH